MSETVPLSEVLVLLQRNCRNKRQSLLVTAHQRARRNRQLTFASGILALVSGASIVSTFSAFFNVVTMKVISAILALLSGITSLCVNIIFDQRETDRHFKGAAAFLRISQASNVEFHRPGVTPSQAFELLAKLVDEYQKSSDDYDRYILDDLSHSSMPPPDAQLNYAWQNAQNRRE